MSFLYFYFVFVFCGIELCHFHANSVLDFSFNLLRNVPDRLEYLKSLHTVYFIQNKISKITGLTSCSSLRSLELGGNKIRVSFEQLSFKVCKWVKHFCIENRKPGYFGQSRRTLAWKE